MNVLIAATYLEYINNVISVILEHFKPNIHAVLDCIETLHLQQVKVQRAEVIHDQNRWDATTEVLASSRESAHTPNKFHTHLSHLPAL